MLGRGLEVEGERENVCSMQTEGSYWLKGTVKLKDSCFESKISLDPEETGNCGPGVRYNNNTGLGMRLRIVDLKTKFFYFTAAYETLKLLLLLL